MSAQDPPDDENAKLRATVEKQARQIEILISALERQNEASDKSQSTSVSYSDTHLDTMSIDTAETSGVRGPKTKSLHPLPVKAKALGKSIPVVAAEISLALKREIGRTTVRSWYAPAKGESARPIPEDAVGFFKAAPWNIPRSAWKNGIKTKD